MEYEKPADELEGEGEAGESGLRDEFEATEELEEVESSNFEETEELNPKEKGRPSDQHTLEVRRAIEDHIERIRLRKELDYLFDEHFTEGEENEKG